MNSMAAIGFCCVDDFAESGISYPTGNGINCIAHLSRRGIPCAAITVVGTDEYGREMLRTLDNLGIDRTHVQVRDGATSLFEMRLTETNDRVHLRNIPGVMADYVPTEDDLRFASSYAYVHTDLFGHVLDLLPVLKAEGARLVLDFSVYANDKNMAELLPQVDYAFFSAGEGNREKAEALLKKGASLGGSVMTATLGEDGSLCYDGSEFIFCPAVKAEKVVNTVGAGDSYIAGFMEGVMKGLPVRDCMENGAALAARVVAQFKPY